MISALEESSRRDQMDQTDGGLFLWMTLPEKMSASDLLPKAIEQRVAYVPGGSVLFLGGGENTLRVNFSTRP